jgi:P27 family predicted phage terminase small subunit
MGDDVQPTADAPEMPKGLSRVARREFRFMCEALLNMGLLTIADGSALAVYCEAVAQKEKALKELNRLGAAIETYGIDKNGERVFLGVKKNPWWSVWIDACKLEKAFLIEFGLTPASRRNLKVTIKTKEDIELEKFMHGQPNMFSTKTSDESTQPESISSDTTDPSESQK